MRAKAEKSTGLARAFELHQNRSERAKELHSEGRKIIGYMCCFPPAEMFTALDIVPLRIFGDAAEPITQADAHLETIMCPFVRSCFDLALKGRYDFLDGVVFPHSCDSVEKAYDIWRYYRPGNFDHLLNVPHMLKPESFKFFKKELQRFRSALEEYSATKLTDDRLRQAIEAHNKNRALLRQLYNLRKPAPPLISGAETMRVVVANMVIPVEEGNALLAQVIAEVENGRGARTERKPSRVLLYGAEVDDAALIELVEDCGVNVVIDDLCVGSRHFWHDVEPTSDPLDGLANRYLGKIPCPRTYRESPGDHHADLENRFGYLKEFAQQWDVSAAILYIIRYCDTFELDAPDVRDYLGELGYPVLHLEHDYSLSTTGQFRTRLEAFLEMIE